MSGAESQLRVIRVDSAVSKLRPLILRERRQSGHRERSHLYHFRKWKAIPFLTHEYMLYRLEQLLQAGHAEVSICKMGSLALPIVTCRRFPRRFRSRRLTLTRNHTEDHMPTFILSLNWTDQGIRAVKDAPKRSQAARELAKKLGVEVKQIYLTSGENDLLIIVDAPSGDNVAKFALATGSLGNVRTRTARAWSEPEFQQLISELP